MELAFEPSPAPAWLHLLRFTAWTREQADCPILAPGGIWHKLWVHQQAHLPRSISPTRERSEALAPWLDLGPETARSHARQSWLTAIRFGLAGRNSAPLMPLENLNSRSQNHRQTKPLGRVPGQHKTERYTSTWQNSSVQFKWGPPRHTLTPSSTLTVEKTWASTLGLAQSRHTDIQGPREFTTQGYPGSGKNPLMFQREPQINLPPVK